MANKLQILEMLFDRCYLLLDNLCRAAEADDTQAIEQTAGAAREFLDTNRPSK